MVTNAGRPPARPDRPPRRCTGCGRTTPPELHQLDQTRPHLSLGQRWLAAGDLEVTWLIPTGRGFTEARFCRTCAPTGTLIDIECAACGDGPLILLDQAALPGMPPDTRTRDRATTYLHQHGWTTTSSGDMTCPHCTGPANTRP